MVHGLRIILGLKALGLLLVSPAEASILNPQQVYLAEFSLLHQHGIFEGTGSSTSELIHRPLHSIALHRLAIPAICFSGFRCSNLVAIYSQNQTILRLNKCCAHGARSIP